jgi:hypothetical protein
MKKPAKKKVAFSCRTWQINPVTRVKIPANRHSRRRVKSDFPDEQKIKIWIAEGQFAGRHH